MSKMFIGGKNPGIVGLLFVGGGGILLMALNL
jgi:hypothetical protein